MNKTHILNEIKRTAVDNEGTGLGWNAFSRLTGIRESDWRGRYWARWGDALQEAGFEPNELVQAYDETELLNKYIALCIKLGRLPVVSEMKMHARQGMALPNWATYKSRFGGKPQLVAKLKEYCQSHPQ